MTRQATRRLPIGAELQSDGGVHFRVWAPSRARVEVVLEEGSKPPRAIPLERERGGYFAGLVREARAGSRYRYRLDGGGAFPDPASRFQPDGPHGPSMVIDPSAYAWKDGAWRGVPRKGLVVYEMHVGTFTREGTWSAAARELPKLVDVGINVLEVMPVADFPGRFGWGYDGVNLFAPTRLYGAPDDFRRFVDAAHALSLGVVLDVVYNHFGPDGNYLHQFTPRYFTDKYENEWGDPLNFDGEESGGVRELFASNGYYWIDEFHLDGLRLDATQQIFDASDTHVLSVIGARAREAARGRSIWIVNENETQTARLVRPRERGGYGLDALWNDDFHHAAVAAVTGRSEAYYGDTPGRPQELISAVKWGYLYQGQYYAWQKKGRGSPSLDLPATAFVTYLENHDQVANSSCGARLHRLTSPGRLRAITALLLLAPPTPMLFQGQEFASSAPFLFFADHNAELAPKVRGGRGDFLAQFPSIASPAVRATLADPASPETFERCKLDPEERERNAWCVRLHRDLLRLRREDPVFAAQDATQMHGAVLAEEAFALRFFHDGDDRLLLVNLGRDADLASIPEPLVAAPEGRAWELLWSSEHPDYGGMGSPVLPCVGRWRICAHSATVLAARPRARGGDDPTQQTEQHDARRQGGGARDERGERSER